MYNKALVLIDFENEWLDKNSNYYVGNISSMLDKTNKPIDYCRQNKYKIIFTTHIEKDSKKRLLQIQQTLKSFPSSIKKSLTFSSKRIKSALSIKQI